MCVGGCSFVSRWVKILLRLLEDVVGVPYSSLSPPVRGSHRKLCALPLTPTIASTEPEQGPNMDLLGTSPKASLGQYAAWQVRGDWEREGLQDSSQVCSCLVVWTEVMRLSI